MYQISNEEFKKFIRSFSDYYKPITEISKNDYGNSLIINDFKMCSFDEMKDDCSLFDKGNRPKSTDAIFVKENDDKIIIYLIEFKFHNLNKEHNKEKIEKLWNKVDKEFKKPSNSDSYGYFEDNPKSDFVNKSFHDDFKEIYNTYNDSVEVSLRLKPFESLYITLPILFEEYCDNTVDIGEFHQFLQNADVKYFIFVSSYTNNRNKNRYYAKSDPLNKQLKRFTLSKIMDECAIRDGGSFDSFLKNENLI